MTLLVSHEYSSNAVAVEYRYNMHQNSSSPVLYEPAKLGGHGGGPQTTAAQSGSSAGSGAEAEAGP